MSKSNLMVVLLGTLCLWRRRTVNRKGENTSICVNRKQLSGDGSTGGLSVTLKHYHEHLGDHERVVLDSFDIIFALLFKLLRLLRNYWKSLKIRLQKALLLDWL